MPYRRMVLLTDFDVEHLYGVYEQQAPILGDMRLHRNGYNIVDPETSLSSSDKHGSPGTSAMMLDAQETDGGITRFQSIMS